MCDTLCETRQCCALVDNHKRCPNPTQTPTQQHCKEHLGKAVSMYKHYKSVCDIAYKMDVMKEAQIGDLDEKIKYLNLCYRWYKRAYEARLKHHTYAFTPDCQDAGHNLQFTIIQDKIDVCEDRLSEIYQNYAQLRLDAMEQQQTHGKYKIYRKEISSDSDDFESTTETNQCEIDTMIQRVKQFRAKRINDEILTNQMMAVYIDETQKADMSKFKLAHLLGNALRQMIVCDDSMAEIDQFYIYYASILLIYKLNVVRYFSGYITEHCNSPTCNCNKILGHSIKLACNCVYKYTADVDSIPPIESYLKTIAYENITQIYTDMLKYMPKIKPLIADLILFYKIYGAPLMTMELEIIWDNDLNRLKLTDEGYKPQKASKYHAYSRLTREQFKKKKDDGEFDLVSDVDSDSDDDSPKQKKKKAKKKNKQLAITS